ncbi:SIMPL domain-containing protein [Shewanella basaltis]|uniref:SIMPL domain-containing protein n=1 Tax=Shewanella basaltis TaxID=472183 RepID=UPI00200E5A76|nr:SIMPL domain-containing protein [Shewanella basaltis]MCL1115426.1 SIMPL domain-containing protein [Shewanella basaltis]
MKKILLLLVFAFLSPLAVSGERIIAIEGSGEIEATPDIIRINYDVYNLNKTDASKAKEVVDKISSESIRSLIKLGVKEEDITSSSLSVETAEDYDGNDNPYIIGHVVKRNIDVIIRDISLYGAVIQSLVDSNVSEIGSVKPDVSNYDQLKREALAKAASNAKENAEFLANEFGARIDKVHQIGKQNIRRQFSLEEIVVTARRRESANSKTTTYDFQPGKVNISSEVYVEFLLK